MYICNYTCLLGLLYFSNVKTGHRALIGTVNFGVRCLCCRPPLLVFDTFSLFCKYFVPSSSEQIEIWLFSPIRIFLCSWPARRAKCNPNWKSNVSKSFWGVSFPRISLHHMMSSCSADITSSLFLSRSKPRLDNSFILEFKTLLSLWNVLSSKILMKRPSFLIWCWIEQIIS